MSIIGIDVSHNNKTVDWRAAADSISFAFVRATLGNTWVDPYFRRNWTASKAAHVPRGATHLFNPSVDAVAQAEFFMANVRPMKGDLAPVLDIEGYGDPGHPRMLEGIAVWLDVVRATTRQNPVIFTSGLFWEELGNPERPGNFPLWISNCGVQAPHIPSAWPTWALWQFSRHGRCAGIRGYVEMNRFIGSLEELKRMSARRTVRTLEPAPDAIFALEPAA